MPLLGTIRQGQSVSRRNSACCTKGFTAGVKNTWTCLSGRAWRGRDPITHHDESQSLKCSVLSSEVWFLSNVRQHKHSTRNQNGFCAPEKPAIHEPEITWPSLKWRFVLNGSRSFFSRFWRICVQNELVLAVTRTDLVSFIHGGAFGPFHCFKTAPVAKKPTVCGGRCFRLSADRFRRKFAWLLPKFVRCVLSGWVVLRLQDLSCWEW